MKLTIQEILEATQGKILQGNPQSLIHTISTDSRSFKAGEAFLCLIGEKFDGHQFIEEVASQNPSAIFFQKGHWQGTLASSIALIEVADTLKAYGDIARAWRRKFKIPLLGIGGSNGKTTTKDMAGLVLGVRYKTLVTEGNLNNLIGVPKMLLRLDDHEAAVIEMGMNDFGELARLTEIVEPTAGLLTNIGFEHLEKLKDLEGVARAEGELFEKLPPGALALVNSDDPSICKIPTRAFRFTFACENPANVSCMNYKLTEKGVELEISYLGKNYSFTCPALGKTAVRNVLAAVAAGFGLGLDAKEIQKGLQNFKARALRMEKILLKNRMVILNDCYNANPSSMELALETLANMKAKAPGLAILGEMKELGNFVAEGHYQVGQAVAKNKIGFLVAVGPYAEEIKKGALEAGMPTLHVQSAFSQEEVLEKIFEWTPLAQYLLVKGSRGAQMEKITEKLKEKFIP